MKFDTQEFMKSYSTKYKVKRALARIVPNGNFEISQNLELKTVTYESNKLRNMESIIQ